MESVKCMREISARYFRFPRAAPSPAEGEPLPSGYPLPAMVECVKGVKNCATFSFPEKIIDIWGFLRYNKADNTARRRAQTEGPWYPNFGKSCRTSTKIRGLPFPYIRRRESRSRERAGRSRPISTAFFRTSGRISPALKSCTARCSTSAPWRVPELRRRIMPTCSPISSKMPPAGRQTCPKPNF